MPSMALAAAPKTQPLTSHTLGDFNPNDSTGFLSATIMGRMFTTPEIDANVLSETDTSLYDYENAKEA